MWRTAGLLAGLLLAVGASGCSRFEPEEYRPYAPGAEIRAWWDEDVACSGRQGNFDRIRWFVVPGESFECPGGTCLGRWETNHRIYIAEAWITSPLVVRHEMLHELLDGGGHPAVPFENPCALTWDSWRGEGSSLVAELRRVVRID